MENQPLSDSDELPTSDEQWRFVVSSAWESIKKDQNPLHIWRLIAEVSHEQSLFYNKPLPWWATNYLAGVAWRLKELAEARDFREYPDEQIEKEFEQFMNGSGFPAESIATQYNDGPFFPPDKAIDRVASALSLTKKGWNAFADWQSLNKSRNIYLDLEYLRERGYSAKDARETVMAAYGFTDERAFSRRLKAARSESRRKDRG